MSFFEVQDLVKYFGGLAAVNGVSFTVEPGEIFGLIGPNGSGKTTIFNLINQFFPVTRGSIRLEGTELAKLSTHKICRLGIGRTFQVVKPLARMTVLDNVLASAFLRHSRAADARERAEHWLDFCNLKTQADQVAGSLPI
ncbi:MAG: ATP-binding cassette domain-containing protein, partial [Proteobacteria bacterium]|nr:ATP-binding cassette domain-containing protein [Pseudomonadota bacterium]